MMDDKERLIDIIHLADDLMTYLILVGTKSDMM